MLGRTVAELEVTMGAGELAEWVALSRIDPWGDDRSDILAMNGWIYSVIGPHARDPGKLVLEVRLPWSEVESGGARNVSQKEFRMMLESWGMKKGGTGGC